MVHVIPAIASIVIRWQSPPRSPPAHDPHPPTTRSSRHQTQSPIIALLRWKHPATDLPRDEMPLTRVCVTLAPTSPMPAKKNAPAAPKPAPTGGLLVPEKIAPLVHYLRHEKVILDSDLAELYGVPTGHLNRAVQRNLDRFPADFMFQLTENEAGILISQIAISSSGQSNLKCQTGISSSHGGRRTLPYASTEQGVAMFLPSPCRPPSTTTSPGSVAG